MAGHSHAANIKHRKALVDKKRSKLWGKLSKAIIVAAQMGGGDPDSNVRLRTAILDAKAVSMPKDNIERAIKKGIGELAGESYEEVIYEGYGPGGIAVLCEITTDNRNRTAPEIRKLFEIYDGKLGPTNCVSYLFDRKGLLLVAADGIDEDRLIEAALDAGADDVKHEGEAFVVTCSPEHYARLGEALEAASFEVQSKQLTRIPKSTVDIDDVETARKILKLIEELDDHDDVQNVCANYNILDATIAAIESA
jgi:YebC/PmpR family DNA-binding regulatory protein